MDTFNISDSDEEEIMKEMSDRLINGTQAQANGSTNGEPNSQHLEVLSKCFGHKAFRPLQWKIINSIIQNRQDNCAIMTTGYGKSLCYQFPSTFIGGITLVISPLISLMEDQVFALQISNIPACLLGTAQRKQMEVIEDILANKYSLVYLTPEFATGDSGQELLAQIYKKVGITLIAIDEAHCVSSWGHDFRTQYRNLGILKKKMPNVPILAVTATATPKVREDIINLLKLKNPLITISGFDRPNLYFSVHPKSDPIHDLCKVMSAYETKGKSTIVYCITRKETERIADILNAKGVICNMYHAGMSMKSRKEAHEQFIKDKVPVMVATIAFGMGIDKPDVRNVIHYGTSSSVEAYYQEVGRAGRDGLPSNCVTFYDNNDFTIHEFLRSHSDNKTMVQKKEKMAELMYKYLCTRDCRRKFLLSYFEDDDKFEMESKPDKCCDNCTRASETVADHLLYEGVNEKGLYDFTKDGTLFMESVEALGGKFGFKIYYLFVRGSRSAKLNERATSHKLYGAGKSQPEPWWQGVASMLLREKYLAKTLNKRGNFSYNTVNLSQMGKEFIKNPGQIMAAPSPELYKLLKRIPQKSEPQSGFAKHVHNAPKQYVHMNAPSTSKVQLQNREKTIPNGDLYELLLNKRTQLAMDYDCVPYNVASDTALMDMAKHKPHNLDKFRALHLDGFTEAKIQLFAIAFLKIVRAYSANSGSSTPVAKRTIFSILEERPLDSKLNSSAALSYSLFTSGLTVKDISKKRDMVEESIMAHLISAMKVGYPIKIVDLGVTEEIRKTVIDIMNTHDLDTSKVNLVKNFCEPHITFNHIRILFTYINIRRHLEDLNIPYEEFEDFSLKEGSDDIEADQNISNLLKETEVLFSESNSDDEELAALGDALLKDMSQDVKPPGPTESQSNKDLQETEDDEELFALGQSLLDNISQDCEPPYKKARGFDDDDTFVLLDSPPSQTDKENAKTNGQNIAKK